MNEMNKIIENNCEFCGTVLKSKSALNNHKKNAKYCILIQNKNKVKNKVKKKVKNNVFNCEHCHKILSTKQILINHMECCYEKKVKELNIVKDNELKELATVKDNELKELNELRDNELKELNELRELNNQFAKEIIEKDKILIKVKTQLESCKEQLEKQGDQINNLQEKLDSITNRAIERPTIVSNKTTNNLNIKSSLDFNNLDKIKDAIETQLNENHVVDGQKGLAKFMVKTMLTDDDGNLLYVCTDSSRNIFKYKNSAGEINKDVEAKKLISFMLDGGIKGKSVEIARGWYTEDGEIDITRYEIMSDSQQSILKIEDDSNSFKKELVSMTTVN